MAEKLCTLRTKGGGGGKQTETVLWTNSSPTSNFSAQNVTISDSVDNYDYIAITYRASGSVADMATVVTSVSDLKKSVGNNGTNHTALEMGAEFSNGTIISRMVSYVSSTSIGFSLGYQLNAAVSNAGWAIPLEILGLNELDHGGMIVDPLWTNPNPTSDFAAQTVSLDLSNYDAVLIDGVYSPTVTPHSGQTRANTFYIEKGQSYDACYGWVISSGSLWVTYRNTAVNANGVVFGGGYYYQNSNQTARNSVAIPMAIYGVKNKLA